MQPQTAAQEFCRIGARGAEQLARIITPLAEGEGGVRDRDVLRASLLVHAHALVWFGISRALPVEKATPLMEAHAGCAHEEFRGLKPPWREEEVTVAIRAAWHAFIESGAGAQGPTWGVVSVILRRHLASPLQGMSATDELTSVVDEVLTETRAVVLAVEPRAESAYAVDFFEFLVNKPTHDPMDHQEDALPGDYPLKLGDVARLEPSACADHLLKLRSYPPAWTADEHWRRRILRHELRERVRKDAGAGPRPAPPVVGRFARPSALQTWLRFGRNVNVLAWVGFGLGLASFAFWFIPVVPLGAIVCSGAGLAQARRRQGRGRAPAAVGLGAGLVFFLLYAVVRVAVLVKG